MEVGVEVERILSSEVEVYTLTISFPLAFFKIPYTVKTRKTYLIPRKKAILSIFNAFFRNQFSFWKIKDKEKEEKESKLVHALVGAELLNYNKLVETQRIIQIKANKSERPPSKTEMLVNARYALYLLPQFKIKIEEFPINYYPFAGQNDYLCEYWKINKEKVRLIEIENQEIHLENYQLVPKKNFRLLKDSSIIIENELEDYVVVKGNIYIEGKNYLININGINVLLY
jgi:CRISPR-associated Cas5-like protein